VPISGGFVTSTGQDALKWDTFKAKKLFRELNKDEKLSKGLLAGSKQAG
jgi:hypothetical protein